jgi:hypothetical protein
MEAYVLSCPKLPYALQGIAKNEPRGNAAGVRITQGRFALIGVFLSPNTERKNLLHTLIVQDLQVV